MPLKIAKAGGLGLVLLAGAALAQQPATPDAGPASGDQRVSATTIVGPGGATPPPAPPGGGATPGPGYRPQSIVNGVQKTVPEWEDVFNVLDAIDAMPPNSWVKPKKARRLLIYSRAIGYKHSVIPITAFAITELGKATGAWTADTSFRLEDITAQNLAKYDALVINSATGSFLDDPGDPAGTEARKKALLDYVRSGHGLVLTHAGGDTYHRRTEGLWPEFNQMVGAFFKWHWLYPQEVTVKLDDPANPINAAYAGRPFKVHDEIYTFAQDSFSRTNVHVLTSVDYAKMSDADKAKEPAATKRTDGDYALSWVRREKSGRVYYNVLGHSEHIYFIPRILQSLTAGIQYAAGDLAIDDSPSVKPH